MKMNYYEEALKLHEKHQGTERTNDSYPDVYSLEETREEHYPLKELNINTLCESIMEKAKIKLQVRSRSSGKRPTCKY